MQAKSSTNLDFGSRLKSWGKQQFKSLAALADGLGISPQHLSAYFGGKRKPSIETLAQLHEMGADLNFLIGGSSTIRVSEEPIITLPVLKSSAFAAMNRTPEDLAEDVEATTDQVRAWMAGSAHPSHRQLALLFNELAKAATALAHCDCEGKHPESVLPATGTNG